MKKLLILIILIAIAVASKGQFTEIKYSRDNTLLSNFDLSTITGEDTSFVFKIMKTVMYCWSIHTAWTGVTGSGFVVMEVTDFDDLTNWISYNELFGTEISEGDGTDAWEDYMLAWTYIRIKIYKGEEGLTGILTMKINLN
jgi:hypothetical protein